MADLLTVYNQKAENSNLKNRVTAAIWAKAYDVMAGTPTAEQLAWAKETIANSDAMANQFMALVVGNAAVQDANFNPSDAQIQTIVNAILAKYAA